MALSQDVNYVILEYVGIIILLFLFGHCVYRSINYILQVVCIITIFNNLNESVLFLHYGNKIIPGAQGTVGCTVSAVLEHFLPVVLTILNACMGFNVWFLIVRSTKYTERELIVWYCSFAFAVPLVATATALVLLRNEPHWTAYPRQYYCSLRENNVTLGTFASFMLLGALLGIFFTLHTVVYLVRHFLKTRRSMNSGSSLQRSIILELSHCIRLIIFSLAFGIIVLMAVMQRIIETTEQAHYSTTDNLDVTSDFSGCIIPFALLIIFGTTKDSVRTMSLLVCPWRNRKRREESRQLQRDDIEIRHLQRGDREVRHLQRDASSGISPPTSSSDIPLSFEDMLREEIEREEMEMEEMLRKDQNRLGRTTGIRSDP